MTECRNLYHLQQFQDLAQAFALEIRQRSCEPAQITVGHTTVDQNGNIATPPPFSYEMEPNQPQYTCFELNRDMDSSIVVRTHARDTLPYSGHSWTSFSTLNIHTRLAAN